MVVWNVTRVTFHMSSSQIVEPFSTWFMKDNIQHNIKLQRGLDARSLVCKSGDVCLWSFMSFLGAHVPMCFLSPHMHRLNWKEGRMHAWHLAWNYTQNQSTSLVVAFGIDWQSSLVFQKNGGVRFGSWPLPSYHCVVYTIVCTRDSQQSRKTQPSLSSIHYTPHKMLTKSIGRAPLFGEWGVMLTKVYYTVYGS
jgi:hypothetical protein